MNRRLLLIALLCLPLTAAAQGSKTKEVAAPVSRMIALANAIASLDGSDRVVKDGASERVVKEPYKFERGFRIAMARNLTALKPILEGYEKELSVIRVEIGGEIKDGSPAMMRLNEENRRLLAIVQKANLFTIAEAELKLDVNQIQISILSALEPIMEHAP